MRGWLWCAAAVAAGLHGRAEGQAMPQSAPSTLADIRTYDAAMVRRAAALISTPSAWSRDDGHECSTTATTFSIRCALQRVADEADGLGQRAQPASLASCTIRGEGSCGPLFQDLPVFFGFAPAKAITTGTWRSDMRPTQVWAGHSTDGVQTTLQQARRLVDSIAGKRYPARLVDFNNDSTTTFATVQTYFRALERRMATLPISDFTDSADDYEIEIYDSGSGVIRTYDGWFAVSGFSVRDSTLRFQIDTSRQVAPSNLDRDIIRRADQLLASDAVWNRADDRKCPVGAKTWSIYCALHDASIEVTGGFHHRRPAMELVRVIIEDRTKGKDYNHRLMGYNNDQTTRLEDVRSLFAEALARVK